MYIHVTVESLTPLVDEKMDAHLKMFVNAIRKAVPRIRVGTNHRYRTNLDNMDREAYLYFDNQQYALMKIGRGDYSVRRGAGAKYMVNSRNIANEKFSGSNDQYNMVFSENVDKAVKNVKKYLKAYVLSEIAGFTAHNVAYKVTNVVNERYGDANKAWRSVQESADLKAELRALVNTDYAFASPALREMIETWIAKDAERKQGLQEGRWLTYVQVHELHGVQMLELLEVPDIQRFSTTQRPAMAVPAAEADADLLAKLSVVNMVNVGDYVEGVGYKVSTNSFWVEKSV